MNRRIVEPLGRFLERADEGTWMCDFQFRHLNYMSRDLACAIHAGVSRNNTTFIVEVG